MLVDNLIYATPREVPSPDDCDFYHVMEIPGHGLVGGQWDLRGHENVYLGSVGLLGKRVLEIGPATGFLTFFMESQGAEVVAVELAPDLDWDIVPDVRVDMTDFVTQRRAGIERTRNGFWFAHRRLGSSARVYYGNVYDLPDELGHFDVAVMASVLLHLRHPLSVVERLAALADTLVISEPHYAHLPDDRPVVEWFCSSDTPSPDLWWKFSPQFFVNPLELMGRKTNRVTYHEQTTLLGGRRSAPFFTVVSERP